MNARFPSLARELRGAGALAVVLAAAGLSGCGTSHPHAAAPTPSSTPAPKPVAQPTLAARLRVGHWTARILRPTALRSRAHGGHVIAYVGGHTEFGSRTVLSVNKVHGNSLGLLASQVGNGKVGWVYASQVRLAPVEYAMSINRRHRQVIVRKNGKIVRRMAAAVGRPALQTPRGEFAVTDGIKFRPPSPYGYGALALTAHQPDIEAGWTGGDRVAVHGTDEPGLIGQAVSHGCVRVADKNARWLVLHVPDGTPVVVR